MRWRRLCIDVSNEGTVLGGSIEFYDDTKRGAISKLVLSRRDWEGAQPHELLEVLSNSTWYQPALPFWVPGRPDF